jgi:hypothetical protein
MSHRILDRCYGWRFWLRPAGLRTCPPPSLPGSSEETLHCRLGMSVRQKHIHSSSSCGVSMQGAKSAPTESLNLQHAWGDAGTQPGASGQVPRGGADPRALGHAGCGRYAGCGGAGLRQLAGCARGRTLPASLPRQMTLADGSVCCVCRICVQPGSARKIRQYGFPRPSLRGLGKSAGC